MKVDERGGHFDLDNQNLRRIMRLVENLYCCLSLSSLMVKSDTDYIESQYDYEYLHQPRCAQSIAKYDDCPPVDVDDLLDKTREITQLDGVTADYTPKMRGLDTRANRIPI